MMLHMCCNKYFYSLFCLIIFILGFGFIMNHQQNVFDRLYQNDQLNQDNQDILLKMLRYTIQTQSYFDKKAHDIEEKINAMENEMVSHNLRQIITINNQHIQLGGDLITILKDPNSLLEHYTNETLEEDLNIFYKNVDAIVYLFKHINTTRFRLVKLETTDAGPGVGVSQYLVRYYNIIFAIIAEIEVLERVHSPSKFSNINISETAVATIKMQTRTQHPITPTTAVVYEDISGNDLVNVDLSKYDEEQANYLKKQSREITNFFVAILNGNKSNKSYIRSRAFNYEEEEKGETMPYLINRDINSIWKAGLKPKNPMHSLIQFTEKVEENHCLSFNRFRHSIDMNPNHWIKEEPDCPLPCEPKPHFTGIGICEPPKPDDWKIISNKKVTNYEVFDYLPPSMEPMKFDDIKDKEKYIPEMILKKYIDENLVYLYENVKHLFRDDKGPIPWDDPIRSTSIQLPDLLNEEIESNFRPNGIRIEHVKQYLNKYLNQWTYLNRYQNILIGDGSKIINKETQKIWNNKQYIMQNIMNDDIKPLFDSIKNVATDTITDQTIFRLMQNRIHYVDTKEALRKKYDRSSIEHKNDDNDENDGNDEKGNYENDGNDEKGNYENENVGGDEIFEPFADDINDEQDYVSSSGSISNSDMSSGSESDENKQICRRCNSHKPPPHLLNDAVEDQWLNCEKCNGPIHWECVQCLDFVPQSHTWICGSC
eukprot:552225_1